MTLENLQTDSHDLIRSDLNQSSLRYRVRRLLALALPIIGGMLSQNVLNLVDTAMVGRLGSASLAAVGMGGMVNWLAASFFMAMGSGVQAIAARRIGAGNARGAVGAVHSALLVSVVVVLPASLIMASVASTVFQWLSSDADVVAQGIPYLQVRFLGATFVVANFAFRGYWNGIGRSTVYLRTILVIHATNILLNWFLIYGNWGFPRLGVAGAGYASAIAVFVGTAMYVVLAWRFSRRDGFLHRGALSWEMIKGVLRLSLPAGVQMLFLSAGFVAFYRIAALIGTRELAVSTALINLSMVCLLPSMGFGLAAATFVGQSLGSKEPEAARSWANTAVLVASTAMVLPGLILALFPTTWLGLLINDSTAVAIGVTPLIIVGLMQPMDAIGLVLSRTLMGAGDVRSVTVVSIVLQWALFLPGAYFIVYRLQLGLVALWVGLMAWRALYVVAMVILFRRGGWTRISV